MSVALWLLLSAAVIAFAWVVVLQLQGTISGVRTIRHARDQRRQRTPLTMVVTSRHDLSDSLFRVTLADRKRRRLPPWLPGQYVTLLVDDDPSRPALRRAYSLARWSADAREYELVIRQEPLGRVSRVLGTSLYAGSVIRLAPPRGDFVPSPFSKRPLLLVAGGVGITPLRAMVDAIVPTGRQVALVHVARTAEELVGVAGLRALQEAVDSFTYTPVVSRPNMAWPGMTGRPTAEQIAASFDVRDLPELDVYLCGPEPMMWSLREGLVAMGVNAERCHIESFGSAAASETVAAPHQLAVDGATVVTWGGEPTLLHCLEQHGVAIERDCGGGSCGSCALRLCAGTVEHLREPEWQGDAGVILACCVRPRSDLNLALLDAPAAVTNMR